MAVAPVAVEMGPRNTRRLITGATIVAVVGSVLAAMLLLLGRPNGHGAASSARTTRAVPAAPGARLIFGMTQQQVRRSTGAPASTQGNCWLFHPSKTGVVGSISVQPAFSRAPYDPSTTGDLKLCFAGGAFSYGFLRVLDQQNHRWVWGAWPLELSPAR